LESAWERGDLAKILPGLRASGVRINWELILETIGVYIY
jgi:hypothetical protein